MVCCCLRRSMLRVYYPRMRKIIRKRSEWADLNGRAMTQATDSHKIFPRSLYVVDDSDSIARSRIMRMLGI